MSTAVSILYCAKCGVPPEYCEYGPDFETHCKPWCVKAHPEIASRLWGVGASDAPAAAPAGGASASALATSDTDNLVPWTMMERLTKFYEKYVPEKVSSVEGLLVKYEGKEEKLFQALTSKYGPEPVDPYLEAKWGISAENDDDDLDEDDTDWCEDGSDVKAATASMGALAVAQAAAAVKVDGENGEKKPKARGAAAKTSKKKDPRVIVQKLQRQKKKAVTIVVGMESVEDIKLKDVAKAFAKRFAGSSSVKDATGGGGKEIIIQGDHQEEAAKMVVEKFKVPKTCVFLDIDGEFVGIE